MYSRPGINSASGISCDSPTWGLECLFPLPQLRYSYQLCSLFQLLQKNAKHSQQLLYKNSCCSTVSEQKVSLSSEQNSAVYKKNTSLQKIKPTGRQQVFSLVYLPSSVPIFLHDVIFDNILRFMPQELMYFNSFLNTGNKNCMLMHVNLRQYYREYYMVVL